MANPKLPAPPPATIETILADLRRLKEQASEFDLEGQRMQFDITTLQHKLRSYSTAVNLILESVELYEEKRDLEKELSKKEGSA